MFKPKLKHILNFLIMFFVTNLFVESQLVTHAFQLNSIYSSSETNDTLNDRKEYFTKNKSNNSSSEFTKEGIANFNYGVTIINHGWQLSGLSDPFEWMIPMAEAIRTRAGEARILRYDKGSGIFAELPNYDQQGEVILLFDWITESDNPTEGFSEAAADALFAALLLGEQNNDFILENFHFIGHSRGCSVNSETVERLLSIGIEVDHVTNLDPHDWGAFTFSDDYDVNPDSLVIDLPSSRSPNRGIVSWEGVGWIDSYWQETGFAGRSVYGSYSLQLQNIGHSNVHEWYLGTIDNVSGENSWFADPYPDRNESGFNYSKFGSLTRPAEWGTRQPLIFTFENDGIINGNFDRGPTNNFDEYPGWSDHGGGGDGQFVDNKLILDQNDISREHNRFYIPELAGKLKFLLNISTAENGTPPSVDNLQVSIKTNKTNGGYDLLLAEYTNSESEKWIEIDVSNYGNSIGTILFELGDGGGNGINSQVEIDNVSLVLDNELLVDISIMLEGVYSGDTMRTTLSDSEILVLSQPYNTLPWNYEGDESVSVIPSGVVDWVLVELRDKNDSNIIHGTRAGFLLSTGKIVDLDGTSGLSFLLPEDDYFISVIHRNHLSVMSANPVVITSQ